MVACKALCVLLICAAVWLTVHLVVTSKDQPAGVVPPMPEKEGPRLRLYTPPAEEPVQGPKFGTSP